MAQSATSLDVAAQMAIENKNFDGMMEVAQAWAQISQLLSHHTDEHEEEREPFQVGFCAEIAKHQLDDEDEDE